MKKRQAFTILTVFIFLMYTVNLVTITVILGGYIKLNKNYNHPSPTEYVFLILIMAISCLVTSNLFLNKYKTHRSQNELSEKWLLERTKSIISTITIFLALFTNFINLTYVGSLSDSYLSLIFSFETYSITFGFATLSTNVLYLIKYDLVVE
ncbi:hypothetical protein [Enterococcus alishanensis]